VTDYDVAVCGLGPVGLLLALLLGDRGLRVLAFDKDDEPYLLPRAAVIDDEVLRIFQSVGVDDAILADSQVQSGASIVTAAGRPVEIVRTRIGRLGHPPLVGINQPAIERTLTRAVEDRPTVELRRGLALETIDQSADRVEVRARPSDGGPVETISANWLVGCDGGHSTVRTQLEIPFEGHTNPQRWVVVDTIVDRRLAKVPHPYFVGRAARPAVTLPISPGRHRWEFMLHPGEDASPHLEPDAIRAAMEEWLDGEQAVIERAVVYTFHTRMATPWRRGRALLAGDAAHLMPPFAGQGFSSGARDVSNLAWRLAEVMAGAPDSLLDAYEVERRPHVAAMQRLAHVIGGFVQSTSPWRVRVRDLFLRGIDGTRVQDFIVNNLKPLPTYGDGSFATRPARRASRRSVGTLFPQTDRLDDRLGGAWAAVALEPASERALRSEGLHVVDPGADGEWLREHRVTWAILRPDRFVFACGKAEDIAPAVDAWRRVAPSAAYPSPTLKGVG
jgi:2-polyprenyl-6-methoxyphenol hydroxylase-like FAD-dependent oxidoreductase